MFDYHIHSKNSFDGNSTMLECAKAGVAAGLTEICFTDHHELDYPCEVATKVDLDFDQYFKELESVREQFSNIKIKTGVETGLIVGSLPKITADLAGRQFDFIIASQHVAQGKDPWYGDYYESWTLREGQEIYLKEILYCIENFDNFDVIGHIGYVDKYLEKYPQLKDPAPFTYKDFPELIDSILKNVISRGKGIEVNTSNYRVHGWPTPHPSILKRYAQLGGEVLTIGSDAHRASEVGYMVDTAQALLLECGIKYVCTFTNRVPEFHKI